MSEYGKALGQYMFALTPYSADKIKGTNGCRVKFGGMAIFGQCGEVSFEYR